MYSYPLALENIKCLTSNALLLKSLTHVFEAFSIAKKSLYLVGGCVRDMLLNKQPKDYDLCTDATPAEVKGIISEYMHDNVYTIDTGLKHGTITIVDDNFKQQFEITTYRIDGKYDDNRHPDNVTFTPSLEEDMKRRDFTINSFAYNLFEQKITMLDKSFIDDLKMGMIRAIGNPAERFQEDALRMIRAIRFSAQMNFSIESKTYKAITENFNLIKNVSKERLRDELTKIILSDNPQMIELFVITGLELQVLDSNPFEDMIECKQHNKYHYTDVFHHTMDVVKKLPKDFILRWSAIFHDMGKPASETTDEEGWCHYYNHADESAVVAERLMDILKFSNHDKDLIIKFVKYHDYPFSKVKMTKFKQKLAEIGEDNFTTFLKLKEADAFAHNLSMSTSFVIDAMTICKERYLDVLNNKEPLRIRDLAINGNDLKELGYSGLDIGNQLQKLLNIVLGQPEKNTRETLLKMSRKR